MKKILFLYFLSIWCLSYSQTFVVADSLTKEPLAFATVVLDEKEMLYSNEKGAFTVKNNFENITVTYLGYNDFVSERKLLKDTIFLNPKPFELQEVIITNQDNRLYKIGYLKRAKLLYSYPVQPKTELVICITPIEKHINSYIETIEFPLRKIKFYNDTDKLYKNVPAVVRVNIYTVKNKLPDQKIFSSEPIKFIMSNKELIKVDISSEMIRFSEEGLCFGIEMIGRVNQDGEFVEENSYVEPIFTDKNSPDYTAQTYHNVFLGNDNLYDMNDFFNEQAFKILKKHTYRNYNLAIGLTLKN